ncbi:MAG TPA: autotransporter-associated beta strand repeat-containing protein, partial [Candidatus Sulfotelmatobacter sp.]|nr:autotransporter-associated beta strand repeat-containing protein [Candidatus Sulfotelmatobacter sp.]
NDVIAISGNLTPSGVTTIQLPTVPSANGTYTLLTVGGTLGGSAANFRVAALSTRTKSFAITYDTASTPKRVLLQVSGSGSTGNLVWQGDGAANLWDITTSRNWLNGANADVYYDADTVNFTDAGAANQPVLDVTVNPGAVNFNATSDYTLTGLGSIAGPTRLTKSGTGTATLSLSNLYSGGTFVTDGVLKLGATNALGSPAGATALASVSGTGTLDLNGMAVDSASYSASTNAIQINGNGSSATKGAIDSSTGYMNVGYGDIGINNLVLLGDSTVSASGSSWQIGNTGLGITGNGHTLTKIGNNLLILKKPAVNPLANLVVAGGGIAFFDRPDAVGATTPIILTNGGLIETWNQAAWNGLTFANPILVSDPVNGGQIANFRTPYYNHPDYDTYNGNITLNGPLTFTNTAYYNGAPLNVDTFGKITVNGSLSGTGAVVVVGGTSHFAANWIQGGNLVVFNGNNSYSGPTLVSNLVQLQISTANQSGGAYDVVDNGTLDVAQAPGKPTMPMSSLTLEAVFMGPGNISFSRLSSLSSTPVLYVTNLVINGGCLIPPVAGYSVGQFPLIKYAGSIGGNGFSSLTLGQLPTGVTAQLVNNEVNHSIDLAVTTSGILWKGTASSIWDLGGA